MLFHQRKRREFITLLGGTAVWPLPARAQQQQMSVIGLLNGQSSAASIGQLAAFRQGLAESGYFEGRNLAIVYRSAEGDVARLPALAAELVQIPVAVLAAVGGDSTVRSAKAATATIPIVFTTAADPVEAGIVASLNRPGGNITGATFLGSLVAAKQIGLLRDVVPKLATIGLLLSPSISMSESITRDVQAAAQAGGLKAVVVGISREGEIDAAFSHYAEQRVDALVIASGVIFNRLRDRIVSLAARHALPAISTDRLYPAAGGLMSYGADNRDAYRQAGLYVSRILRGDKPGNLPVVQPTKFVLVINMKTTKALGLTAPPGLLAIADEVIE
jgi:putative tryptophan/tyrosine transport system substrate-binding protein